VILGDVAVDASGNVYVADNLNSRVQKFAPPRLVTGVEVEAMRPTFLLAAPKPNPWAGRTTLGFSLAREGQASVVIYDVHGRQLKRWSWPNLPVGPHQVIWDGQTGDGRRVPNGVLFYRLETGGKTLTQKMVRLR
jgi:hypothetical protein